MFGEKKVTMSSSLILREVWGPFLENEQEWLLNITRMLSNYSLTTILIAAEYLVAALVICRRTANDILQ